MRFAPHTDRDVREMLEVLGLSSLVEAVSMARHATRRPRVLVSEAVDPRHRETLRTYGRGTGYEPELLPAHDGITVGEEIGDDVAAVVIQHPNAYGILEPAGGLF